MSKVNENNNLDGNGFAGGSGTLGDPYLISDVKQLSEIRNYLGSHFKQVDDIYNTPEYNNYMFEPIGNYVGKDHSDNEAFTGTFNGNGYKLISWGPIFELIGNKGEVKDLKIESTLGENVEIFSKFYNYSGAIARYNHGVIEDCSVINDKIFGSLYIGGLVGYNMGYISDCYFQGMVMGDKFVGGIAGYNSGFLSNNIACGFRSGDQCGGITGVNRGIIEDCIDEGTNQGKKCIGGLIGRNSGEICRSYSYSTCRGQNNIGGLVGINTGKILDCIARGFIGNLLLNTPSLSRHGTHDILDDTSQENFAGGLVGMNLNYIARSYSDCNIEGFSDSAEITFNSKESEIEIIDTYYNPAEDFKEKRKIFENWDEADTDFLNNTKLPVIESERESRKQAIKRVQNLGDGYTFMW